MKQLLVLVCCISSFSVSPTLVLCQRSGDPVRKIDSFVRVFAEKGHFSGVVRVSRDEKTIYEKAFGLANADFRIPNELNTRIGIASITKPMTVVILLQLIEEGKVAYGDRLAKYLPTFPNADRITIEHLARHRAGIPHRVMSPEIESVPQTSEEIVAKIAQAKLEFEPGEKYSYSSGGFTVLARALEIASGKSYQQLLEQYVFAPVGMKDSMTDPGEGIIERSAQDYFLDENGLINAPLKDYAFLVGAGSVYSTAADTMKFAQGLAAGVYGEGARQSFDRDGVITASGSTNGHRAYFRVDTKKKYGYVVMSNLGTGAFDLITSGLEAILEGRTPALPAIPSPVFIKVPEPKLAEYLGVYKRDGTGTAYTKGST